ncbi:hypothetical protein EYF80_061255 [Liparis tanakae]|uniref:Uncharacterized protein n=1 Tax=Liparis tanakae TaxID=230148 RepID=A0A4Z2EI17_9TELE|nr:hypothetical protein EYF80_061255 [Liparis tanakae]
MYGVTERQDQFNTSKVEPEAQDRPFSSVYRNVVACVEKPVADEVKAGDGGAQVNPLGFREKVDSREQLVSDAVIGVMEVGLWLSQGTTQHTLGRGVIHTHTHTHTDTDTDTYISMLKYMPNKQIIRVRHESKTLSCRHFLTRAFSKYKCIYEQTVYLKEVRRHETAVGPLADISRYDIPVHQNTLLRSRSFLRVTPLVNRIETHRAILAVSPAACRHPQMPTSFRVCCREPPPKDTPSHLFTAPEVCKAQSTALLQYECAALEQAEIK